MAPIAISIAAPMPERSTVLYSVVCPVQHGTAERTARLPKTREVRVPIESAPHEYRWWWWVVVDGWIVSSPFLSTARSRDGPSWNFEAIGKRLPHQHSSERTTRAHRHQSRRPRTSFCQRIHRQVHAYRGTTPCDRLYSQYVRPLCVEDTGGTEGCAICTTTTVQYSISIGDTG
jgi:hypothetical protein